MVLEPDYRASAAAEIRRLRRRNKLGVKALGDRIGRDHATIVRVEKQQTGASRKLVEQIVVGLELSEYAANRLRLAAGFAPRKTKVVSDGDV